MFRQLKQKLMLRTRLKRFYHPARRIGLIAALRLLLRSPDSDIEIRPKGSAQRFLIRGNSSDANVFEQVFIEEEYGCLTEMTNVGLIIDAGANVGYASIFFLSRFPDCRIVAVEPDPKNFATLKRNLEPYADRVVLHNTGLWSHSAELVIDSTPYRDGREWTRQVRECEKGESGDMKAISVEDIIKAAGYDRVSLLKIDIEGAEAKVFAAGASDEWLGKIDTIAIELHDDSQFGKASDIFFSAIEGEKFSVSHNGELVICRRTTITKQ